MKVLLYFLMLLCCNTFLAQNIKPKNTLPVELVYFYAEVISDNVNLFWGTATETNNYGYNIERGFNDSLNFETITFVPGHGNSYSPKDYTLVDTSANQTGKYYYRLMQIDTDGNFEYSFTIVADVISSVKEINSSEINKNFVLYQNYPNPFNPSTKILISLEKASNIKLEVYNSQAELISIMENRFLQKGEYYYTFNGESLSSGIYFYHLITEKLRFTRKMILLK